MVWREKRGFTRGRKTFVKIGMSFGVRCSTLTGVGKSGPPEVLTKVKKLFSRLVCPIWQEGEKERPYERTLCSES